MKKTILFLAVFTLVLISCSKDNNLPPDSLVGTWNLYQRFENNVEQTLTDCDRRDVFQVNADGTVVTSDFDDLAGPCILDEMTAGTWENRGNNMYALTFSGSTETREISFENNTFSFEDVDGNTTIRDVFIRN